VRGGYICVGISCAEATSRLDGGRDKRKTKSQTKHMSFSSMGYSVAWPSVMEKNGIIVTNVVV
jgi:hypothetical protein